MRCIGAAVTVAATAFGLMSAGAADWPVKAIDKAPPPFWISAESLLWSAKGDKLPPLVTTSPAGTPAPLAGVPGAPGTSVLFGNESVNDRWRSGARVSASYWFDPLHTTGIEANFFMLNPTSTGFAASSNGNAILARPFVDAITGLPAAQLAGSLVVNDSSRLLGAGAAYRTEFCRSCAFGSVSGLIGYRYLHLRDSLVIAGTSTPIGGGVFAPGTTVGVTDQFDTTNAFHGFDLGLTGDLANGPWKLTWLAKLAIGGTFSKVAINGGTVVTAPGTAAVTNLGGLYALPTNIGSFDNSRFAVAPELAANVSYQISGNLRAFAGYSVTWWTGLVRPGGAIDTAVNPTQLPPGTLAGPARPQAQLNTTDYWVQGFNVGLAYDY